MAEEIGSLHIDMSLTNADFKKGMQDVGNRLKVAQSEFKLAGAGIKDFGKSMDGLKAKSKLLENTLKAQKEKVDFLKQRYEQLKSTQGENAASTQRMLVAYNNAQAAMRTTQSRLEEVTGQIELQSNRWHQLGERLTTSGQKFAAVDNKMKDVGKQMSMKVTAPIMAFGAAGVAASKDFNDSFNTVIKKTGVTGKAVQDLEKSFRNVIANGPDSFADVGAAVGEVNTQFGFMGAKLEDISDLMLQFTTITGQDVTSTSISAKKAIEAYGLANKDVESILDAVAKTSQNTGQATQALFDKAIAGAPQIKALGLTFAQGSALIGNFEKSGVNSAAALGYLSKASIVFAKDGKTLEQGLESTVKKITSAKTETEALTLASKVFGAKGASKMIDAIKRGTFNLKNFENASKDATRTVRTTFETTLKPTDQAAIAYNNVKLAMADVGNAIQVSLLPYMQKATDKLKDVAKWVQHLTPEAKKNILVWGGIAAAIGPVLVVSGALISSVGTIITTVGAASTAIAGSAGLTAAMAALTGPIGLVTGGVVLGTAAVVGLTKAYKDHKEISFESLEAKQKEIDKNDELIRNYNDLRAKNQLSNEQMLRFLDIQSELASTASPERIADLKDEQAKLLKKSTLTNAEMKNFLKYNDDIIKKAPNTEKAISSQGNAFAKNTSELQKVNAEKLKGLKIDAELAMTQNLEKENGLLANKNKLQEELNQKESTRKDTYEKINTITGEIQAKETEVTKLKKEQLDNLASGDIDAINRGKTKLEQSEQELSKLKDQKSVEQSKLETILKQINGRQDSLDKVNKDLKALDASKYKYEALVLAQVGLNSEKGKGLEKLETEISKLQQAKQELSNLHAKGKLNTAEYNDQVGAIDEQIGKLQVSKSELTNINEIAGKTVYKDVIIDEKAKNDAEELNQLLRKEIYKNVYVSYPKGRGPNIQQNAKGTRYSPEGLSWVGEEGPELMYLPRGARIVPNPQSEQLLRSWNIPMLANGGQALASGIALVGERGRELVDMRGARTGTLPKASQENNSLKPLVKAIEKLASREISIQISGREFIRATANDINDVIELLNTRKSRMGGGL